MVISLVIGTMAQRMLEESMEKREQELREKLAAAAADGDSDSAAAAAGGIPATANKSVGKQGRTDR